LGTAYRGEESMYLVVKRCIDIIGAGLGLIVLSPVSAVAIRMQMDKPLLTIKFVNSVDND
jgi:lipopolysaccharide/colanic/teichoic acid biosynthesis glycosyltransferase